MNKLKRRIPNYCYHTPDDLTEHPFETLDQMLEIDWIAGWANSKGFESFYVDRDYLGKNVYKDRLRLFVKKEIPTWPDNVDFKDVTKDVIQMKMWPYFIGFLDHDIPELPTFGKTGDNHWLK